MDLQASSDDDSITARVASLQNLLELGRFEPASVQREFQWDSAQATRLLVDLIEFMRPLGFSPSNDLTPGEDPETACQNSEEVQNAPEGSPPALAKSAPLHGGASGRIVRREVSKRYFLGPIVMLPAPRDVYFIYDGFQRITTLLILLSVLRGAMRAPGHPVIAHLSSLMRSTHPAETRRLRASTSAGTLARLLGPANRASVATPPAASTHVDHLFVNVRNALHERVAPWSDAERAAFLKLLLHNVLVSITLVRNRSAAYQIFVGANARGKPLSLSDVLKGKVIEAIDRGAEAGVAERYARRWSALRRRRRAGFDDLLSAAEFLRYLPSEAYQPGDLLLSEIEDVEEAGEAPEALSTNLRHWIDQDLEAYAQAFESLRAYHRTPLLQGADLALLRLSFLSWKEWVPVAMQIHISAAGDARWRSDRLQALQRASYILDLVQWDEAGRREKAAEAVRQLSEGRDPFYSERRPNGEMDYGALAVSGFFRKRARKALDGPLMVKEKRGPIVRLLETLHWTPPTPKSCTENADVEHILPQALKNGWEALYTAEQHEYWCNRLGNLCLIDKNTNLDLQAGPWPKKKTAYLKIGEQFRGAKAVAMSEQWRSQDIEARHHRMVAIIAAALDI